jgi:hypothetical protein
VSAGGFANEPLLRGVSTTGPTAVGVMVNVRDAEEPLNASTIAVDSPPPEGVMVIVPLYAAFAVTVKFADALPTLPPAGPVSV